MKARMIVTWAVMFFGMGVFCGVQFSLAIELVRQTQETEKYRVNYELLADILQGKVKRHYVSKNDFVYKREVANESPSNVH